MTVSCKINIDIAQRDGFHQQQQKNVAITIRTISDNLTRHL
jgi:hypothetical protein